MITSLEDSQDRRPSARCIGFDGSWQEVKARFIHKNKGLCSKRAFFSYRSRYAFASLQWLLHCVASRVRRVVAMSISVLWASGPHAIYDRTRQIRSRSFCEPFDKSTPRIETRTIRHQAKDNLGLTAFPRRQVQEVARYGLEPTSQSFLLVWIFTATDWPHLCWPLMPLQCPFASSLALPAFGHGNDVFLSNRWFATFFWTCYSFSISKKFSKLWDAQ